MPLLVGLFWGGFISILSTLVGRVLIALAIGYVTYQGLDILLNSIKMAAFSNMGNMGPLVGVVGMLKLSESMNVIMSALVAKYTIMGMTNGSITKMVFKK